VIVAIDLDDCIIETSKDIIYRLESHFGIKFDWDSINEHNLERVFCLDKEIIERFVDESLENSTAKPFENVVTVLNNIGHRIYIISHRRAYLYDHTKKRLDDLGLKQYELILSYSKNSEGTPNKSRIINDIQADIVVEDRADTIMDLYEKTRANIIIYDRPWNTTVRKNDRIYRAYNWYMISQIIDVLGVDVGL
jgi:uncharacterized HAD superfamily protein